MLQTGLNAYLATCALLHRILAQPYGSSRSDGAGVWLGIARHSGGRLYYTTTLYLQSTLDDLTTEPKLISQELSDV